jgi:hypothetical protein
MYETTGVLRPAVEAYLRNEPMTPEHAAALRAYLRQWMAASWVGTGIEDLRKRIDGLTEREHFHRWFSDALDHEIDPL